MIKNLLVWLYSQPTDFNTVEKLLKTIPQGVLSIGDSMLDFIIRNPDTPVSWRESLSSGRWISEVSGFFEKFQSRGIQVVSINEPHYPSGLLTIANRPPLLFYQGMLPKETQTTLAIVGSRKATAVGLQTAYETSLLLAKEGVSIISGLAEGIDTVAHQGALKGGGYTAAILGNGLNHQFPASNRQLRAHMVQNGGCILSEFPPDMPALPHHFPRRNRLISGISNGVLLVEAGLKSGSLITANTALQQGRDVFAVPGNVKSPVSMGTNHLIKLGAVPVTEAQDILDYYSLSSIHIKPPAIKDPLTEAEALVYNVLVNNHPMDLDRLKNAISITSSDLLSTLTFLEIKGYVERWITGEYRAL